MRLQLIWRCFVFVLSSTLVATANEEIQICRFHDHTHHHHLSAAADNDGPDSRKYAPNREVDVLHIKLDVTPDFTKKTIAGTTRIDFAPIAKELSQLRLDAVHLDIQDVRGSVGIRDYITDDESLTIIFERPIRVGEKAHVEIEHSAEPRQGFYFRTAEMGYQPGDAQVWTQGEPHEARHWFPCIDYPNEKSSTEVICHVPQEMTVLSNGRLVSESTDPTSGLKSVHWLQEKPHVTYLICLVAGHLTELTKQHRDVPLRFYTQPSVAEHAKNAFSDTEKIMAYFEDEIGMHYPWEKYDQVTILDFTAGGMENTSLTTLTHYTVNSSETENIHTSHGLDAHEMAHQWFGDYVTCKDWSHLWLNEGFATYYTHLYEGHKSGREAMLYGLYRDAQYRILSLPDDKRPIVYKKYQSASEQFDYRAYPKGSWVLHMLRSQLGEELYRKAILLYLQRHALGTVETENLVAAFEEVTGQSLDRFFDQWVYHARFPDVTVRYRWLAKEKLAEISIEQTQPVDDNVLLFQFPATVRFYLGDGYDRFVDHQVDVNARKQVIHVPLAEQPTLVRFDPEYTLLARVTFEKPNPMLMRQLANPNDMIGRILAIKSLQGRKSHATVKALTERLQSDAFYGVRIEAGRALAQMGTDESLTALMESTDQDDARVRSAVISSLASKYRPQIRDKLIEVIKHERNPEVVAAAIQGLAKYQDDETTTFLRSLLNRASFRERVANAAVQAIRSQDDQSAVADLQKLVERKGRQFESRDLGSVLETVGHLSRDSDDKRQVRDWLAGHLVDPKMGVRMGAVRGLGSLRERSAAPILESFRSDGDDDRFGQMVQDELRKLDQESEFVPQEVKELRGQLHELQNQFKDVQGELSSLRSKMEAKQNIPSDEQPQEPEVPAKVARMPREV